MANKPNIQSGASATFYKQPTFTQPVENVWGFDFHVGSKTALIRRCNKTGLWTTVCGLSNEWTGQPFKKLKDAMIHVANFFDCLNNTVVQSQILQPKRIEL
tara:strand:+ start:6462 stop:6764 length:303 start_codon:yes stop_codon:yes gene_type:complete